MGTEYRTTGAGVPGHGRGRTELWARECLPDRALVPREAPGPEKARAQTGPIPPRGTSSPGDPVRARQRSAHPGRPRRGGGDGMSQRPERLKPPCRLH